MKSSHWFITISVLNLMLSGLIIAFISQSYGPGNAVLRDTCFDLVAKEFCVESRLVYPWELGGSDNVMMALKVKKGATFFSPDSYLRAGRGVGSGEFVCVSRDTSSAPFNTAFNICINAGGEVESSIPYNATKVVTNGEPLLTVKTPGSRASSGLPRIGPLDEYHVVVSFR